MCNKSSYVVYHLSQSILNTVIYTESFKVFLTPKVSYMTLVLPYSNLQSLSFIDVLGVHKPLIYIMKFHCVHDLSLSSNFDIYKILFNVICVIYFYTPWICFVTNLCLDIEIYQYSLVVLFTRCWFLDSKIELLSVTFIFTSQFPKYFSLFFTILIFFG